MLVTAIRCFVLALGLIACTPPAQKTNAPSPYRLPTPHVTVEADTPPPFTYWAPEGSVIRNHANPGLWVAYLNDRNVATYFGDSCHASDYQRYIGAPLTALPPMPDGAEWRQACESCAVNQDLRFGRMNIVFSDATNIITRIACY